MKHTSRMIALAGLAILVIAMLHLRNPLQHSKSLLTECWTASQLLADGGAPMPPWPPTAGFLTVDPGVLRTAVASGHSGTPRA
ncbi:MAG TPA: hypothetical protein VGR94_03140 [Candidatus Acidoferrales bacterium]|nr:hypothetical protein [Candidatus Acidoferrales bacterium]